MEADVALGCLGFKIRRGGTNRECHGVISLLGKDDLKGSFGCTDRSRQGAQRNRPCKIIFFRLARRQQNYPVLSPRTLQMFLSPWSWCGVAPMLPHRRQTTA